MPGPRWTSTHALAGLGRAVAAGWRDLPQGAVRRWIGWTGSGFLVANLVAASITVGAERLAEDGRFAGEQPWLERFVDATAAPLTVVMWVHTLGDPVFLALVVAVAAVGLVRRGAVLSAASVVLAYPMGSVPVMLAWVLWDRPRPDVLDGAIVPPLHAFPSGHTVQAMAVYGLLAFLWMRRTPAPGERVAAALLAALAVTAVALARLRLGLHWPTDVLGAVPIGIVWLAALTLGVGRAEPAR